MYIKIPENSEDRIIKGQPFFILLDSMGGGKEKLVEKNQKFSGMWISPGLMAIIRSQWDSSQIGKITISLSNKLSFLSIFPLVCTVSAVWTGLGLFQTAYFFWLLWGNHKSGWRTHKPYLYHLVLILPLLGRSDNIRLCYHSKILLPLNFHSLSHKLISAYTATVPDFHWTLRPTHFRFPK